MTRLEGLASGVPVVASKTGYFEEFSNEGRCGKIVPIDNVKLAVKQIQKFIEDKDYRLQRGVNGRSFVEASHSISKEAKPVSYTHLTLPTILHV